MKFIRKTKRLEFKRPPVFQNFLETPVQMTFIRTLLPWLRMTDNSFTNQIYVHLFLRGKTLKIVFWFTEQSRKKYFQFLLHNSQSTIMMTNHPALAKKMYNSSDRDGE